MQTQTTERRSRHSNASARGRATASRGRRPNALTLLKQDHENVSAMFEKFEKGSRRMSPQAKQQLAQKICMELTVHAQIEEELFYPQVEENVKGADDLVSEAEVEHETLKRLVADIENCKPDDERFDALVTVLGEYTRHHVKEEQNELFPKVRKSKLDLTAMGDEIAQRKEQLMGEQGETLQ
jgi:hemerythrin superfamily protein